MPDRRRLLVAINPSASFGRGRDTGTRVVEALRAAGHDVTALLRPSLAALEAAVAEHLAEGRPDALVVVGGDGAAAVLTRLGASSVEIDGAVVPGCPTGTVVGGRADGLRLVTKSGGFGVTSALDDIVRVLRATAVPAVPAGPDHPHAGPRPTQKEPS